MRKKKEMKKLALAGLIAGFVLSGSLSANEAKGNAKLSSPDDTLTGNLGYHLMTEEELLLELSPEGAKMYNSLSPEGKELARRVASARCDHTNDCRGLGVSKHECAGKNDCKQQGKCAIPDKDLAVKLVRDKMAKKRAQMTK